MMYAKKDLAYNNPKVPCDYWSNNFTSYWRAAN